MNMEINNFDTISKLLNWENENDFYFIQILKRKKENKDLGSNSYVVKTYYITSIESLELHKEEMKLLANFHQARVYINLNKRNFEKCSLQTARIILDQIANKDYKSSRKAFNTICGKYSSDTDKKWIIDIDDKEFSDYDKLRTVLQNCEPIAINEKIQAVIPTKNGCHVITSPFNVETFKKYWSASNEEIPEIHKNNPTILYMNC
jgi:hypothetical protein